MNCHYVQLNYNPERPQGDSIHDLFHKSTIIRQRDVRKPSQSSLLNNKFLFPQRCLLPNFLVLDFVFPRDA